MTAEQSKALAHIRVLDVSRVRAGPTCCRILGDFGLRPVIVELNVDTVRQLSKDGHPAVYGDASHRDTLRDEVVGQ